MWCMIISVTSKSLPVAASPSEAADKGPTAIHINSPVKRKKALMHKQLKNQTGIRTCLGHYTQPRPVRFKKMAGKHLPGYSPNSFWQPRQTHLLQPEPRKEPDCPWRRCPRKGLRAQ